MKTDEILSPLRLAGLSASPGMCWGKAFVLVKYDVDAAIAKDIYRGLNEELQRLSKGIERAIVELERLKERTRESLDTKTAHIFRSQQTILEDQSLRSEIEKLIRSEKKPASGAANAVFASYVAMFSELSDTDYNKGRMADIADVHRRLLLAISGLQATDLSDLERNQIIVAEELLPSDTAVLDPTKILGFVTEKGSITSHVAILAKNLGLPAAVGVVGAAERIRSGQDIFLDTASGPEACVCVDPDPVERKMLLSRLSTYQRRLAKMRESISEESVTRDGFKVQLSANIGSLAEAEIAISNGAKSVGLFRTEFLFLGRDHVPDEDEQFHAYRQIAHIFAPETVIIRTLDIGGDKIVPALSLPNEANPFLGYRGIRISLGKPELLETQLRAAFRANDVGNLKIMFPMISSVEEVRRIIEIRNSVVKQMTNEGTSFNAKMEFGIMIELPSVIFVLEDLCKYVDFFSIGTNDLTQYLFGADRGSATVSEYYRIFGPAVLRSIARIVEVAHHNNKWVGICGELGGMPSALPFFVGLGVDELSMSSAQLSEITHILRSLEREALSKNLVPLVLSCETETEVLKNLPKPDLHSVDDS